MIHVIAGITFDASAVVNIVIIGGASLKSLSDSVIT